MSYNPIDVRIVAGTLQITPLGLADVLKKLRATDAGLPESMEHAAADLAKRFFAADGVSLRPIIAWRGEGAGHGASGLHTLLASCTGDARILVTWEDGRQTGLIVRDGSVTLGRVVSTVEELT